MVSFDKLPDVIIGIILEYDGRIRKRNGYYMNQLGIGDPKYDHIRKYMNYKPTMYSKIPLEYNIFERVFYMNDNIVCLIFGGPFAGVFAISLYNGICYPEEEEEEEEEENAVGAGVAQGEIVGEGE